MAQKASQGILESRLEFLELDSINEWINEGVDVAKPEDKARPATRKRNLERMTIEFVRVSVSHLANKGQCVGEEEREPTDKKDNEDDDEGLGSIYIVSQ